MKKLNIIGCGNVGKTLGFLWSKGKVFEIGDILDSTLESSRNAVDFIKSGNSILSLDEMQPADIFLISTPDDKILNCCQELIESKVLNSENIVFICSGSIQSSTLKIPKEKCIYTASIHPIKSFADPNISINTFTGTFCASEGDKDAVEILTDAFQKIGGKVFSIDSEFKILYHSATVIVCNYLTALLEYGTQTFIKSGVDRKTALKIMEPLVQGTVDNIFKFGTVKALTGPIARGDFSIVSKQLDAQNKWNIDYGNLYKDLGKVALGLSKKQGTTSNKNITTLSEILN
ncbi:MAG TPA: DUF2520 domain-containing protein [Victivallales bacterium]|nr:DUF2520 domain-containing protein [Victivallales bacterium]